MRLFSFLVLASLPSALHAGRTLQWHFPVGESFRIERVYHQSQEIEVKGRAYKQETTSTWLTRVDIKEKRLGAYVLQLTLEDVSYTSKGVSHPVGFDNKLAAKMKGLSLTLTVTTHGEIKKLQGYGEFVKRLSEGNVDTEKVLRALFTEEGMQETYEEIFACLPTKSVDKGARWKRSAVDPVPPFGSFKSRFDYVYDGIEDGLHAIKYTIVTTYQKPGDQPDLFRVVKGSLTGDEGKGKFLFDANTGRLVRGEKTMVVRGQVTVETGGVQTVLQFVSNNRLKVRVVPVAK